MINRTVLVGRLTKDADVKTTGNGVAVATFTIAVNRTFKNANGEREADFINCVIWRQAAENFAKFTHKGSLVAVEGRLQTRSYDNNEGQRIFVTELVVDNFSLLEPKNDTSKPFSTQSNINTQPNTKNANTSYTDPFANNDSSIDISDNDLPF